MNTMPGDIAEDGSFTLPRVSPGRYRVYFSGTPVYVKSMRLGTVAFDGPVLDVSNGGGGALTMRVASSKGSVSGVLSDAKGPIGGGRVALLEDAAIRMSPMFSMTKEDGSFLFKGVAPGKYLLFPVEGGDLNAATNLRPEDVEDIAENIEVGDGAAVTKALKRREGK